MKKVSIIVPCYNEEEILSELFRRITVVAETWELEWEVICVDDGSSDSTLEKLISQNKKDGRWKIISFSRNFGHQPAISCGIYHATGDAVIVIDADLQDPPEELHRFIKKWQEGYEVVYAVRTKRKENIFKRLSYWLFYRIMARLSSFEIPLDSGDFCVMDRKVVNVLNSMPEKNRFVRGLRAWSGFKQTGLEYERQARVGGDSKYTFKKLVTLALDGILSFSSVPLTFASYLGVAVSVLSLGGMTFTLVQRIFKDFFSSIGLGPVPGFATIVISILFLGGVQLIFLGIIGTYLSRIYDEVKGRPQWIIKEVKGVSKE